MRANHVTTDEMSRLTGGELSPDEVLRVARHIGSCADCADAARRDGTTESVVAVLVDGDEHPDVVMELTPFVDGELLAAKRAAIEEHVTSCARCREDLSDLRLEQARLAKRAPRFVFAAIAAAAAAAFVTAALLMRAPRATTPLTPVIHPRSAATTPVAYDRTDWDAAVHDAVATRSVARPEILSTLRPANEVLRGREKASLATLSPIGEVVGATQPRFSWTSFDHARYVVSVFSGDREIASSGEIAATSWTATTPLPHGETYTWQVEVKRGDSSEIIPAPPQPPAMFRVAGETTARDLADAQRRYPNDHLLLGVLAARAGMTSRAEEELRVSSSPAAPQILAAIERW
jgi:anti-sigma factor RsiW